MRNQEQIVYIAMTTKIVPATAEALRKFPKKDLESYAKRLGVPTGSNKEMTIDYLICSRKATLCASLGD